MSADRDRFDPIFSIPPTDDRGPDAPPPSLSDVALRGFFFVNCVTSNGRGAQLPAGFEIQTGTNFYSLKPNLEVARERGGGAGGAPMPLLLAHAMIISTVSGQLGQTISLPEGNSYQQVG